MKYIVYLTTNNKSSINGINRIYIGVHKTENPEIFDGYLGCGTYVNQPATYMYPKTPFQYAVKKYGPSAFKRVILYIFDTRKEAFDKEEEIVNIDFIKLPHVYNAAVGGCGENAGLPIYQFDLEGNLVKKWEHAIEAFSFYNVPKEKFNYAIYNKHPLLDCLWARTESIDISEYSTQPWGEPKVTHLYSKEGKWLGEFISRKECAEYLNVAEDAVISAIKKNSLLSKMYYVSDKLVDEFKPKARKYYEKTNFYVYENYKYIGEFYGRELLRVVRGLSWEKIRDRLRRQSNWIQDFYVSEEFLEESKIPPKKVGNGMCVDVYTKYGEFIETLSSIKDVKTKYKVHASKIKNIQLGDRYVGDYIFKYHSPLNNK